jgi:hypothetical protein
MAFGEWMVAVDPATFGRDLVLHIFREVSPGTFQIVKELSPETKIETVGVTEGTNVPGGLALTREMADALYQGLHQRLGNSDPKGTEDALKIERARVDTILNRLVEKVTA